MRVNQVIAVVLLSVQVAACTKWRQTQIPSPSAQASADVLIPEQKLRVTLRSGERIVFSPGEVSTDSVRGRAWNWRDNTRVDSAVAYSDVARIDRRGVNWVTVTIGIVLTAVLAACASRAGTYGYNLC